MSQVTIYIEDKLEQKVRHNAKAQGISVSKWIVGAIEANDRDSWPPQVVESFGTWGDDVPELAAIRASFGQDGPRETFD